MEFLHNSFTVFKFLFGLGALCTLIGLGLVLGWFCLRFLVQTHSHRTPGVSLPTSPQALSGTLEGEHVGWFRGRARGRNQ
jgi:hypothetical protein